MIDMIHVCVYIYIYIYIYIYWYELYGTYMLAIYVCIVFNMRNCSGIIALHMH